VSKLSAGAVPRWARKWERGMRPEAEAAARLQGGALASAEARGVSVV
jgi:hypothetical protein